MQNAGYFSDLQQCVLGSGLEISADKTFVVTAFKPQQAKGLKAISAEVLTNIEKTRLNDILITNHFCFFL